ncbi:MAG: hypothetical protein ACYC5K_04975 [Saccharofermentanales bacterium]
MMGFLKKVILIGCLVLQIGVAAMAGAGIVLECTLLNPAHYGSVLQKADIPLYIYDDWDGMLDDGNLATPDEQLQAVMLQAFAKEFDQIWLKDQLGQSIEASLAFIKGDADTIPVTVDFKTKKEHFAELLASELGALPDEKLAQWGIARGDVGQKATELMQSEINIPDFLSISEELIGDYADVAALDESLETPRAIRKWYFVSLVGVFLLLTVIVSLLGGMRKSIVQAGRSIVFAGAVLLIAGVPVMNYGKSYLIGKLVEDTAFLQDLIIVYFNKTVFALLMTGLMSILIGFLLIYIEKIFIPRRRTLQRNGLPAAKMPTTKLPTTILMTATLLTAILTTFPLLTSSCSLTASPGSTGSTDLGVSGKMEFYENLVISEDIEMEILGVTVTPHVVSGEIPSYDREDPFAFSERQGALIKIFVYNKSTEQSFDGEVLFNGKTGQQMLDEKIVSWCSVPDTRASAGNLTTEIPSLALDVYTLNVIDSRFYEEGLTVSFIDAEKGIYRSLQTTIEKPEVQATGIIFTSSDETRRPDGLYAFFRNDSGSDVEITGLNVWTAAEYHKIHWWKNQHSNQDEFCLIGPEQDENFAKLNLVPIRSGGMNAVRINLGEIPYGETVFEFSYDSGSGTQRLMYVMKPMVIDYDINLGWAVQDLARSEAFAKTAKILHFNTVHGGNAAFTSQTEKFAKYPFKGFDTYADVYNNNAPEKLAYIHGVEFLGEPQLSNADAQEIFNKFVKYRLSAYPTTLTLTHEPGFYHYAGLADMPHFDAYRVVAPHSDKWGEYERYGDKNTLWGAPLETIGDYMRTLQAVSQPNPVAAWTQGVAGGWTSVFRITAPNPNNLEIRIQAHEAIANGAKSLYWFNINGTNMIKNRDNLSEIQHINREIKIMEKLLTSSVPFSWENRFMDIDLNVLAGYDFALLFACDLQYRASPVHQFVSDGPRKETMVFDLPDYLLGCDTVLKISYDGVRTVPAKFKGNQVELTDTFDVAGNYVAYNSTTRDLSAELRDRYENLIADEESYRFNPITSDSDFNTLKTERNQEPLAK